MAKGTGLRLSVERGKLIARAGHKYKQLSYAEAFALGHLQLESGNVPQADHIFDVLAQVPGRAHDARVMLAKCRAAMRDFEASEQILLTVFDREHVSIAEGLQAAFVYQAMGLHGDAIGELSKLAKIHANVPSACLMLADLLRAAGKLDRAAQCWKLAIKQDRTGAGVATTAKKELNRLAQHPNRSGKIDPRRRAKPK